MFLKLFLISTLIIAILNSRVQDNIQTLYKNGIKLIQENKHRESNHQLLLALKMKKHPQIFFWISYNYAKLNQKDSCQFYFNQITVTPPQPLSDFYLNNAEKIEFWLTNNNRNSIVFMPTLSKKQRDSLANSPENWGLGPEQIKAQLKRIYSNSINSIKIEEIDSLQLH